MDVLKSPAMIPLILSLVMQAAVSAEVLAVGPVGANCRYPVDGACAPKRGTYGYHQPNWRRMRDTLAAAPGKSPAALPANVPNVILPDPSDEEEQDIRQPTQSLPRPSGSEATPTAETLDVDEEDPFRDDVGQLVEPGQSASEDHAVDPLSDSLELGTPSASLEGASWPMGHLRPARYEDTAPRNARSLPQQQPRHVPADRGSRSPFASAGGNPLRRAGGPVQRASAIEAWEPEPLEVVAPSSREPLGRLNPTSRPPSGIRSDHIRPRSASNPLRNEG